VPFRLFLLAAFTLCCSGAFAQTFKSGVDLIRFDVRIVDQNGRPITDLRQDEIVIEEQGRALPVSLFQRITEPAESYVDAALRAVTAQVSSNDGFPRGHQYILIFDQQHITPGNEQRARAAAAQFIRRQVRPSDRVALFGVPGPGPQIGFTADKTRALKELESIRGSYERKVTSAFGTMTVYEAHRVAQGDVKLSADIVERMSTQAGSDAAVGGGADLETARRKGTGGEEAAVLQRTLLENARVIVNQTDAASRQFLQRLADVIAQFRDIEGRKTVVLFSEGFFQDNLSRELETVAAAAAQSYCVFYAFDLNQRSAGSTDAHAADTAIGTEIQARIAPLATLAVETDGMMVVDAAARTDQALDRIAEQAQDYYLVGFAPSSDAKLQRGKYQRVTVRVTRPGARVSSRTGYAMPPERVVADKKRAIDRVLGAPFVQQGLKLDYTTYVMKAPEPGTQRVVLSLNAALPERSSPTDVADVVFVARDVRDGRVVASGSDTIPLPAAAAPGAPLAPGTWRVHFNVPAGSYMMRTVVREPGGLVGSADRRIDVRPLDGPDISASDLVLGTALGGLAVRARAYAADGLTGALETYGRTQAQLDSLNVKLELRRVDDNSPVTSIPGEMKDTETSGGGFNRRVSFVLPLTQVPPGEYLAHATVSAGGEVVAERTRHVEVLAGRAAVTMTAAEPRASAADVARGDIAKKYIAWIQGRTQGTAAADAARRATEGRWEEVELALRRLATETADSYALRGFALFAREEYAAAAAALQQSMGLEENPLTAFFLGWAQDGAGNSRASLSAWRTAAHLNPSLVSAHLALADGYLKVSEPALAVQALRAGLTALPASVEIQARLQQLERIKQEGPVRK
jgi:VWFA-related protein